jgi:hypothetical protein
MLKSNVNSTRLEWAVQGLENFVLEVKSLPEWQLNPAARSHLTSAGNAIRGQLTDPALREFLAT